MEIQIFDDILTEDLPVYWHGNEYYLATFLTEEDREKTRQIACAKYRFKGAGLVGTGFHKVFDQRYRQFYQPLYQQLYQLIFKDDNYNNYIFYIGEVSAPNRIRSYKGILKQKYRKDASVLEIEEPFMENKTIFAGMILLSTENFYEHIDLIINSRTGFLINSKENYFSASFIQDIIGKYQDKNEDTSIKYLNLIIDHCLKDDRIYKIWGDGADGWLTLECYFKKEPTLSS